ncbi:MAG: Wzz/FepE/Etk N-terminal domain-containing protein [Bacteroidia bacterium]
MPIENILIFKKIFRRRKQLLLVTFATAVVSYLACFLITPVYKSTAFVYPANIVVYSEESTTEQLLQFMNSNEVRMYLLKKFNLYSHYKIDSTKKLAQFYFDGIYEKKFSISQTKYESIELKVEDSDPDTARMLVNGVIEATNWLIEKEHREKYMEVVKNSRVYLEFKKREVDSTQKILTEMSEKYGLLNVSIQLKEAVKNAYKNPGKNPELANLIQNMNKLGVEQGKLATYLDDQLRGWAWANNDYQKKLSDYMHKTTFTAMASKATRPVVPSWPKKSIVVTVSCLSVLLISFFYFIFIDRIKLAYEQIASEE